MVGNPFRSCLAPGCPGASFGLASLVSVYYSYSLFRRSLRSQARCARLRKTNMNNILQLASLGVALFSYLYVISERFPQIGNSLRSVRSVRWRGQLDEHCSGSQSLRSSAPSISNIYLFGSVVHSATHYAIRISYLSAPVRLITIALRAMAAPPCG